jgi:transposase
MKQAENGLVSLLFLDASHFVMGCDFLGYVYGKTRRFVKTFSGRKRYNVLGALDFVSKKITTVTNDTYITATEICEMLRKISQNYVDKTVHIILDNARYQKCAVVQDLAKELGIRLIFIPPYSPNLNLIERFWKFTKSKLRSRYYSQFDIFQETIDFIIESTHTLYKDATNQLIGEKIQLTVKGAVLLHDKYGYAYYDCLMLSPAIDVSISHNLKQYYHRNGWLERIGQGVYILPGDTVD